LSETGAAASDHAEPSSQSAAEALSSLGSNRETGLSAAEAAARLRHEGPNDVPEKKPHRLVSFARKFWGLSAWMIELIALISFILGKQVDFWIALGLLLVNAVLSFVQEQHAAAAVTALRSRLHVKARALRDRSWKEIPAPDLVRGDVVRVRSGDFVAADMQVLDGEIRVDQSMLTGESRDLRKSVDAVLRSGSVVREGEATAVVIATGARTYFGRTAELVESAHPKLHIEEVTARVVRWLFLIVGVSVTVTVAASIAEGLRLLDVLPISLVLLMSAVPVALPVMFTVSMAVGSLELAHRGVLVTRLSAAEDAANMNVLCADKTGTLTPNHLALVGTLPQPGFTEDDVLRNGADASNEADRDPIDLAFLGKARERGLHPSGMNVRSFVPFSPKTRRTEALIEEGGGEVRVMKGALRTLAELAQLDAAALAVLEARADEQARKGVRVLAVARAEADGPLRLVGLALLRDPPRPDSRGLIEELHSLGVAVKILTGDALPVAQEIGRELGLPRIARAPNLRAARTDVSPHADVDVDGYAEIFPEDKFLVVENLQASGNVVGMTGDGVNDAPALRQAEVGIAVADATDVAKAAASVVLTTQGLGGIVELVKNGRAIYQRVLTWIINKVSRTILKAGFVVIGFLVTGKFVISALGMVLLVFMTDFVKIALSTDRVRPSHQPESWNIGPLVALAVALGILMLAEALGLLAIAWQWLDLGNDVGRLQTFTFETLLFFALFSIVSIRERRAFWASRPGTLLTAALAADACVGILIGQTGLAELRPLPLRETAAVLGYSLICSLLVNDLVKSAVLARFWKMAEARAH
jgi:plasma-membrane proton-efflux P-type ATPase